MHLSSSRSRSSFGFRVESQEVFPCRSNSRYSTLDRAHRPTLNFLWHAAAWLLFGRPLPPAYSCRRPVPRSFMAGSAYCRGILWHGCFWRRNRAVRIPAGIPFQGATLITSPTPRDANLVWQFAVCLVDCSGHATAGGWLAGQGDDRATMAGAVGSWAASQEMERGRFGTKDG